MFTEINLWLGAAALLSAATFCIHLFVGTREIAHPLLEPELNLAPVSRYTNYYCWHLVTITLLVQALAFGWSALDGNPPDAAFIATVLAAGFALWSVILNLRFKLKFDTAPQWIFFIPIAIVGLIGLLNFD